MRQWNGMSVGRALGWIGGVGLVAGSGPFVIAELNNGDPWWKPVGFWPCLTLLVLGLFVWARSFKQAVRWGEFDRVGGGERSREREGVGR